MSVQLLRLAQGQSEWTQQSASSNPAPEKRRPHNEARLVSLGLGLEEDGDEGQQNNSSDRMSNNKGKAAEMDPFTALMKTGSFNSQREASKAQLRDDLHRASIECERPEIGKLKQRASFQDHPRSPRPKEVSRSSVEYPRSPKRGSIDDRKKEALKIKTELQNDMMLYHGCEEDTCDPSDVVVRHTFAEPSPQTSPAIKEKTSQGSVGRTRSSTSIDRRSVLSGRSSSSGKPGEESSGTVEVVAKQPGHDYTYGKPKSSLEKQQEKSMAYRFFSCFGMK